MGVSWKKPRLVFGVAALVGVAARLAFAAYAADHVDQSLLDVQTYSRIAQNILHGHGFSLVPPRPTVFVGPLYPAFLAGVGYLTGSFQWAIVLHALLWVLTAWLVYRIGVAWFGGEVATLSALFVLLHPELVAISAFLYSETLFITLLYASLALTVVAVSSNGGSMFKLGLAGFCLGLATLTRPVSLYFAPILALVAALRLKKSGTKVALRAALVWLLTFAVAVLPWTIRNYLRTGRLVPVAVGGGTALWVGNYLPFDGEYRYDQTRALMNELTQGMDEVEADRHLTHLAVRDARNHPVQWLRLVAKKVWRYWIRTYEKIPDGRPRRWTIEGMALQFVHLLLLAFAACGLWVSRRQWQVTSPFLALAAYLTAMHALSLPVPRYRLPLLPGLLLFAAVGVCALFRQIKLSVTSEETRTGPERWSSCPL